MLLGMVVVVAITLLASYFLIVISHDVANYESYQYLAYMRLPVLLLLESIVLLFLIACFLAFPVLIEISQGKPFTRKSVRLLRIMAICFLLMIAPLLGLVIYTESQVPGSITNLYAVLGMGIAFLVSNIFGLLASLIEKASEFEEEVNLTI
ncbi:DUF2975 domain-containing protein [Chloroflexota bacterium]|nr:DUF2975 domain-containing protein [Chloroflexota bacterium]